MYSSTHQQVDSLLCEDIQPHLHSHLQAICTLHLTYISGLCEETGAPGGHPQRHKPPFHTERSIWLAGFKSMRHFYPPSNCAALLRNTNNNLCRTLVNRRFIHCTTVGGIKHDPKIKVHLTCNHTSVQPHTLVRN